MPKKSDAYDIPCDFCGEREQLFGAVRVLTRDGSGFEACLVHVCKKCRKECQTKVEAFSGLPIVQAPLDGEEG